MEYHRTGNDIDRVEIGSSPKDRSDRSVQREGDVTIIGVEYSHASDCSEQLRIDSGWEAELDRSWGCLPKAIHRVCHDEPTLFDDRYPIDDALHLVEFVGRQEDRPPLGDRFSDELLELVLHERVESGRWLIKHE